MRFYTHKKLQFQLEILNTPLRMQVPRRGVTAFMVAPSMDACWSCWKIMFPLFDQAQLQLVDVVNPAAVAYTRFCFPQIWMSEIVGWPRSYRLMKY